MYTATIPDVWNHISLQWSANLPAECVFLLVATRTLSILPWPHHQHRPTQLLLWAPWTRPHSWWFKKPPHCIECQALRLVKDNSSVWTSLTAHRTSWSLTRATQKQTLMTTLLTLSITLFATLTEMEVLPPEEDNSLFLVSVFWASPRSATPTSVRCDFSLVLTSHPPVIASIRMVDWQKAGFSPAAWQRDNGTLGLYPPRWCLLQHPSHYPTTQQGRWTELELCVAHSPNHLHCSCCCLWC